MIKVPKFCERYKMVYLRIIPDMNDDNIGDYRKIVPIDICNLSREN
jgi:hypothetical protein